MQATPLIPPPSLASPELTIFPRSPLLAAALGLSPLLECYRRLPSTGTPADFACRVLEALEIEVHALGESVEALPVSGPLMLTANHPFGGVEGLVLAALCSRVRPDLKILVNSRLYGIPELRGLFIPVEVFGGKERGPRNVSGMRAALRHLKQGGALALFPAGVVSHWHARKRCVTDPEWNAFAGRLALAAGAGVVPCFFEGRNSLFFQAAGCVHSLMRTLLLPREMWRLRGSSVRFFLGKPVDAGVLSALRDDRGRAAYIRACCYALGRKSGPCAAPWPVPVAAPGDPERLRQEIRAASRQNLVEDGPFQVFPVRGDSAPHILREIGRLREETFRAEREGSGKAVDIDRFDRHYTHLVLWDREAERLAGSYRVRLFLPGDKRAGLSTLYTASLFRFKPDFFTRCGVSMELGRAFVARPYQRDYAPLLLLWKGIARLAVGSGARVLFGACSIGLGYSAESILLLRRYLEEGHYAPDLAACVRARRPPGPFPGPNEPNALGLDYRLLNRAVSGLESGKGLPILFKHYLQLGGRIAAFHEDHAFGTLDALMIVSMESIPEKFLERYLGAEYLPDARVRAHVDPEVRASHGTYGHPDSPAPGVPPGSMPSGRML